MSLRSVLRWGSASLLAVLPAIFWLFAGQTFFVALYLVILFSVCIAVAFPLTTFFAAIATAPMIGWLFSIPLPQTQLGERAFAGSIDIPLSDAVAGVALFSAILLLIRQQEWSWAWQRLPLKKSYAALVIAHVTSLFSGAEPNRYEVVKFALRPVALSYFASIALPLFFIRTVKILRFVLGIAVAVGMVFAIDGGVSLFVGQGWLAEAHPLWWGSVALIGTNHNVLAELLLVTAPFAFALAHLTHDHRARSWLYGMGAFMSLIALLTFSRTAWIVFLLEGVFLSLTVWRVQARTLWQRSWLWILALSAPFVAYMILFSSQVSVEGSTDARATLTGIAWRLFRDHPFIGVGAGTFLDHVAHTWSYQLLFGGPMDAHGVLQKIAPETGLFGLVAFGLVWITIARVLWRSMWRLQWETRVGQVFVFLNSAVFGAIIYQLFNTTYWTAKLWLPVGIVFAARQLFLVESTASHV